MKVHAGKFSIHAGGSRKGWYFFTTEMLTVKAFGRTIRFLFRPDSATPVYVLDGVNRVAYMRGSSLQFEGMSYRLSVPDEIGTSPASVVRETDGTLIAESCGKRTMEIHGETSPIIFAFCLMTLCLSSRIEGLSQISGDIKAKTALLPVKSDTLLAIFPVFMAIGTAVFILLSSLNSTVVLERTLILTYAIFMIGSIAFVIARMMFGRVKLFIHHP